MKLLLYCTKAKPYLYKTEDTTYPAYPIGYHTDNDLKLKLSNTNELANLNGKIVAECDYECEPIFVHETYVGCGFDYHYYLDDDSKFKDLEGSCLTQFDMKNYLGTDASGEKVGYAIHIKNLHIFDEPKKLEEVYKIDNVGGKLFTHSLKKAPQNMMYVSANRWIYDFYEPSDINILISIRPQWLCKILNGEKTIEVRKKVLKNMLK